MSDTPDGGTTVFRKMARPFHRQSRSSASFAVGPATTETPRMSIDGVSSEGSARYPFGDPIQSKRRFKSYRLKGEYEKAWLTDPAMKKTKWNNFIVGTFITLGLLGAIGIAFVLVWPYRPMPYCLIYEDDFKTLDESIWTHEVQIDGFGTGAFDWTTTDEKNSYVDGTGLHIVPTLTNETTSITNDEIYSNYTLNLLKDKTCTGTTNSSCVITSNPEKGDLIPPVRSARLSTKGNKSIRYGRVEVVAKLPIGDWIWPAIWMMPEDSVYGPWPASGEIDIMESRGNARDYGEGGRNWYYSTLHWGADSSTDAYWRTTSAKKIRRGDFAGGFHTFGIQWTAEYMYFYIDSRIHQIYFNAFKANKPLWEQGDFAKMTDVNGTLLNNPWADTNSTTGNAPFDQKFYLILNVAVGARNGWFLDKVGDKPWSDASSNAQWGFWDHADDWLPTWGEGDKRGMTVKSVKMWQAGACGASTEL